MRQHFHDSVDIHDWLEGLRCCQGKVMSVATPAGAWSKGACSLFSISGSAAISASASLVAGRHILCSLFSLRINLVPLASKPIARLLTVLLGCSNPSGTNRAPIQQQVHPRIRRQCYLPFDYEVQLYLPRSVHFSPHPALPLPPPAFPITPPPAFQSLVIVQNHPTHAHPQVVRTDARKQS